MSRRTEAAANAAADARMAAVTSRVPAETRMFAEMRRSVGRPGTGAVGPIVTAVASDGSDVASDGNAGAADRTAIASDGPVVAAGVATVVFGASLDSSTVDRPAGIRHVRVLPTGRPIGRFFVPFTAATGENQRR